MEGSCYILKGSVLDQLMSEDPNDEKDDDESDDDEDKEESGIADVPFTKVGDGMCRGEGWQTGRRWPKHKGTVYFS